MLICAESGDVCSLAVVTLEAPGSCRGCGMWCHSGWRVLQCRGCSRAMCMRCSKRCRGGCLAAEAAVVTVCDEESPVGGVTVRQVLALLRRAVPAGSHTGCCADSVCRMWHTLQDWAAGQEVLVV